MKHRGSAERCTAYRGANNAFASQRLKIIRACEAASPRLFGNIERGGCGLVPVARATARGRLLSANSSERTTQCLRERQKPRGDHRRDPDRSLPTSSTPIALVLGHADIRITADLYAHLQKQTAAKAATIMDGVLGR